MALLVVYALLSFLSVSINAQLIKNPCFDFNTCDSCISHPLCKWIINMNDEYSASPDTQMGKQHCILRDAKIKVVASHIKEAPLVRDPGESVKQGGLNINPSNLKSESAIGDKIPFRITVRPIEAIKLNIYFLVHLTNNLEAIKNLILEKFDATLRELKAIQGINPNIMIGIGKFSDIPVFPFVKLPAGGSSGNEMPGYVFSNMQSLIEVPENLANFKSHFQGSDNRAIDQPESVLDAMAQVSECKDIIKWNMDDDVFRLLIVITDSKSKRAGHGNIIGHYRPNDGSCKLTTEKQTLKTIKTVH
ncbi:Integrin beta-2 [Thelohanellus kitauei]|uniref:Integrin beta n=1 Tax=Thelohanellus kitauei TaxID=669202 RepID=A0A0C2MHL1_THEKT|nr:Integrin beta-2 [Thelohanellus kitauei]